VVWDDDPNSATYAGPDPVNFPEQAGPFGVVPHFFDTPLPLEDGSARQTAMTILARVAGLASQVSLSSAHNPAIDAAQVIDVLPPGWVTVETDGVVSRRSTRTVERHIVETVTHPLDVRQAQRIDARSTRTDEFTGGA
jgi:hypothetical protein